MLATHGRAMDDVHRSLLPLDEVDLGLEGFAARIEPYRSEINAGDELDLEVWVRNPFPQAGEAAVELVVPAGWAATPAIQRLALDGRSNATVSFRLRTDGEPVRRARIAADVRIGDRHLGQHAEALVTVR
jgi:hypothetical protein